MMFNASSLEIGWLIFILHIILGLPAVAELLAKSERFIFACMDGIWIKNEFPRRRKKQCRRL